MYQGGGGEIYGTRDLEHLTRLTHEAILDDPLWEESIIHSMRIARIMRVVSQQPELMKAKRLKHNLGRKHWDWLEKAVDRYREIDPDIWR